MEAIYTAVVTSRGGRNGHIESSDGILNFDVRSPKEMGGKDEGHTNPEQLFAAGWAACFNSAINLAAMRRKINIDNTSLKVSISIGRDEDKTTYRLAADIELIAPGMSAADADYLLEEAHKICPYSKATRGNIDVHLHAKLK